MYNWKRILLQRHHILWNRFSTMASSETVIPRDEMHAFIVRCMEKVGTKPDHDQVLADLLVAADYRGHYSHGLNRLDMYVRDIESKICVSDAEPKIAKETAATALVNGNNVLGPVIGKFCIDIAIKKAKEAGIGWVSANGSNHFGIAGWYSIRAMEQGLIGLAFTNTSPLMVPTRGKTPILGTNPLSCAAAANNGDSFVLDMATTAVALGKSCAAAANNGDSFVLDMATTAVALGKLELNERKGLEIPLGWGCDSSGKATKNPSEATGLMPLGGTEECSGYKGYGLAMMVEVFCGILAGANFGSNVRRWKTTEREANLGQCYIAIDPSAFAPGFSDRLTELITTLRNLEPAAGETEVLVAGDPERKHMTECDKLGGIPYHENQVKFANDLASKLEVAPPKTL